MPMILKIMLHDNSFADDSPYASHHVHEGVASVRFNDPNSEGPTPRQPYAQACVTFSDGSSEHFAVPGNAYLMNENGKTISTYAAPPRLDTKRS